MKRKIIGILVCMLFITTIVLPVAGNIDGLGTLSDNQPVLSSEEYVLEQKEVYREVPLDKGWYWKQSYPNYAPSGMPDFDQRQDQWKSIKAGSDGIADTTANPSSDDIQVTPVGQNVSPESVVVAPGPDCELNTSPHSNDTCKWCFCGPVSVANCFWWFDSKYANPNGYPGDGQDDFGLVEDYNVGDDHAATNVPELICKLANAMKTCEKGTTHIGDMHAAIDQWFNDTGLDDKFQVTTYNKPTFEFIEEEIVRSQDVILSIGYYDIKKVDQEQTLRNNSAMIQRLLKPGCLQGFTPKVSKLDAVQLLLDQDGGGPTTLEVSIYDAYPNSDYVIPIGVSTMVVDPYKSEWYQFHFNSTISLYPEEQYYIGVRSLDLDCNIYWSFYKSDVDIYPGGYAYYTHESDYDQKQEDWDFTFKTEYYDDCIRKSGHAVTCAGVNSEKFQIAISDPGIDRQNYTSDYTEHNNAMYVSHDIYNVTLGCPCPNLDYEWWLPEYSVNYAIVEQAVIICPKIEEECCLQITNITGGLLNFAFPLLRVKADIKNTGTAECRNVTWGFNFSGGIILFGPNSGTIPSILPGGTAPITSKMVIGYAGILLLPGSVTITADAVNNACLPASETKDIIVFGLLLKVKP